MTGSMARPWLRCCGFGLRTRVGCCHLDGSHVTTRRLSCLLHVMPSAMQATTATPQATYPAAVPVHRLSWIQDVPRPGSHVVAGSSVCAHGAFFDCPSIHGLRSRKWRMLLHRPG